MTPTVQFRVYGMDCASCAGKVARAVQGAGVNDAQVSIASATLDVPVPPDDPRLAGMHKAVTAAGYRLERIDAAEPAAPHLGADYARALWIVVALNLGYGVIEMAGGELAGSQALKADALDFIGDGLITLLGVVALGWGLAARARSAMAQGVFLGALGLAVLAETSWRVLVSQPLEPALMGAFGALALVVNVAAALVLLPHRTGDANMRAVWLFSRNDAIGNAAVVLAAIVAGLSGSRWPDLIVAFAMAALFVQAAVVILRDARRDLATAGKTA